MQGGGPAPPSLLALRQAADLLAEEGFRGPSWQEVLGGARPGPQRDGAQDDEGVVPEPGEMRHGWQFVACTHRTRAWHERVVLPSLSSADRAIVRSGSGRRAADWLIVLPTAPGLQMTSIRFQIALRRRLRLPLLIADRRCGATGHGCGLDLDARGDHRASCPRTGLLARRAGPVERAWFRVAQESGARAVRKQLLRDTNAAAVPATDRRQLDLVAYGLTRRGTALCCDATVVSPLDRNGRPHGHAADMDGFVPTEAEGKKRWTYPELLRSPMCKLVVLGCEVGGRWNSDAFRFVQRCAQLRELEAPRLLRNSAAQGWRNRWWGLLSVAVQDALAATLCLEGHMALGGHAADPDVPLEDVLLGAAPAVSPSRLPLRA